MSEQTYHLTKEDIRTAESKESAAHGGDIPKGSDAAALQVRSFCASTLPPPPVAPWQVLICLQSIVDQGEKSKGAVIEERKANLPLPDQPAGTSDFSSADSRAVH